jgi:hypothetical protein
MGMDYGYDVDPNYYYGEGGYDPSQPFGDETGASGEQWYDESSDWDPEAQT